MFRLENPEVHEEFVADSAGNKVVELLVDRIPIGTCGPGDISERVVSFAAGTHIPFALSESVSITNF